MVGYYAQMLGKIVLTTPLGMLKLTKGRSAFLPQPPARTSTGGFNFRKIYGPNRQIRKKNRERMQSRT